MVTLGYSDTLLYSAYPSSTPNRFSFEQLIAAQEFFDDERDRATFTTRVLCAVLALAWCSFPAASDAHYRASIQEWVREAAAPAHHVPAEVRHCRGHPPATDYTRTDRDLGSNRVAERSQPPTGPNPGNQSLDWKPSRARIHTHVGRIIEGIGVCLPGRTGPNAKDLIFIFAPNLRWPIVSLKAKIERASGLRVRMDNVANACALSEVWSKGVSRQKCVALRDL